MQFFLLQANVNNAENYLPIALQVIFAVGLIVTIIIASNALGPKRKTAINSRILKVVLRSREMPASQWPSSISWLRSCSCYLMWK